MSSSDKFVWWKTFFLTRTFGTDRGVQSYADIERAQNFSLIHKELREFSSSRQGSLESWYSWKVPSLHYWLSMGIWCMEAQIGWRHALGIQMTPFQILKSVLFSSRSNHSHDIGKSLTFYYNSGCNKNSDCDCLETRQFTWHMYHSVHDFRKESTSQYLSEQWSTFDKLASATICVQSCLELPDKVPRWLFMMEH